MIIGINGYIGSGKDTVGKIIQNTDGYYAARDDMGAGQKWYWNPGARRWEIKKFAAKLKEIASILTGIAAEKFEDQEFKKTFLPIEWATRVDRGHELNLSGQPIVENKYMTVREFLQKLGTEAVRNNIHTNAWVNALFADYKVVSAVTTQSGPDYYTEVRFPNWIITDTRFPNEAQAIKDRGGIIVRVERRFYSEDKKSSAQVVTMDLSEKHPSETSLDKWPFDWVINNNSTIEDLTMEVKKMLEHFNLLS